MVNVSFLQDCEKEIMEAFQQKALAPLIVNVYRIYFILKKIQC